MADYTVLNLKTDVEDMAPGGGMAPNLEARFARIKLEDDLVELKPWDAIRVPGHVTRALEAGPDGAEILAFGAPNTDGKDTEMVQGWWDD